MSFAAVLNASFRSARAATALLAGAAPPHCENQRRTAASHLSHAHTHYFVLLTIADTHGLKHLQRRTRTDTPDSGPFPSCSAPNFRFSELYCVDAASELRTAVPSQSHTPCQHRKAAAPNPPHPTSVSSVRPDPPPAARAPAPPPGAPVTAYSPSATVGATGAGAPPARLPRGPRPRPSPAPSATSAINDACASSSKSPPASSSLSAPSLPPSDVLPSSPEPDPFGPDAADEAMLSSSASSLNAQQNRAHDTRVSHNTTKPTEGAPRRRTLRAESPEFVDWTSRRRHVTPSIQKCICVSRVRLQEGGAHWRTLLVSIIRYWCPHSCWARGTPLLDNGAS